MLKSSEVAQGIRITASNVGELRLKEGETLKFSYQTRPLLAEQLQIKRSGQLEGVISHVKPNGKFDGVRDVQLHLAEQGIAVKGFIALTSGKGWLYATEQPSELR